MEEPFRAIGDEQGLLLVFKRGRELGAGSGQSRGAEVFRTDAAIRGGKGVFEPDAYPYRISAR